MNSVVARYVQELDIVIVPPVIQSLPVSDPVLITILAASTLGVDISTDKVRFPRMLELLRV